MSFVPRTSLFTAIFSAALLAGNLAGVAEAAAKSPAASPATSPGASAAAPKPSGLHARVGQGGQVDLAASRYAQAELEALRPNYQQLKPRVRSNAE
ncbi:MAG: hypothetical protein ABI567_12295 [Gammaproteobacteria bacterium]